MLDLLRSHYAIITSFIEEIAQYDKGQQTGISIVISIYARILDDAQSILLSLIDHLENVRAKSTRNTHNLGDSRYDTRTKRS